MRTVAGRGGALASSERRASGEARACGWYRTTIVWTRVLAVFRAGFQAQWGSGAWPVAPLVMHGSVAAVLCGLVSNELPPFAYALYALSVSAALIALPLLGDFGALLRRDSAAEWIRAQPVRRLELGLARVLLLATLVCALVLAALIPAALFAPGSPTLAGRAAFIGVGLAQAACVSAVLFGLQSVLSERAEGVLVALQTLLVAGVIVGVIAGLRWVPHLMGLEAPSEALFYYPPAWFAAWWTGTGTSLAWRVLAPLAVLAAVAILIFAPPPPAQTTRRRGGVLALLLRPARALATRAWVRRGPERGCFDLVYDMLPLEREFVLRSYPMIGIPLAFLLVGARGQSGLERDGLLSVLLFTPATYLPILIIYSQATASHRARWLLDTAPAAAQVLERGAIKALAVRFLLPLYVALGALTAVLGGIDLMLRLAVPGALVSLLVMRVLYPMLVPEPPLSVAPENVRTDMDWTGILMGLALGLTVLAILAVRFIETPLMGLSIAAGLFAVDMVLDRKNA